MSDEKISQWRITTRSAHRLSQENSNMQDSDTSSSPSGSLNTNLSTSPKMEPKLELKEEPTENETRSTSSDSQLSPAISQAATSQVKDPLGMAPILPSPFTGRKRKANFSNEETETLVRDVVKHFSALYGTEALRTESTRRNQRRSQLWNQIQKNVNELGYTPRTIDDLKHKWRDLRLEVKRKITHKKTSGKPPAPGVTPIIDTKLTPLEDLVASTIGHHCTLDGEQEGMYMEPGVPRQSIFFSCRGPNGMPDLGGDRLGSTASPRPPAEISLMPSLINSPPAQLTFAPASDEGENEDQEMEVTPKVMIKPFTDTWTAVSALLATTQNHMTKHSLAPPAAKKFIIAQPEMLTVKQELIPLKSDMETGRCESQGSVMSSNEDSLGPSTGQAEWTVNSNGDNKAASVGSGDTIQLKVEDEVESQKSDGNSQEAAEASWNENQDEWERQSASPQPSENAQEDSAHSSSSQEEEPNSAGELARNGECASPTDEHKGPWRTNMHRLLELEEQWDSMYHRELGMWEEERAQQREQRAQDRELQQQLLSVLTDIRDELRYIREERVAARQNQASNGSPLVVSPPPPSRPVTPAESLEPSSEPHSETPAQKTLVLAPLGSSTPGTLKRTRGRPRLLKPTSLPDNES